MDLKKAIYSRKSVKHFATSKADWRKVLRALDYARMAPLAGNLNAMKFIVVQDEKIIQELAAASQQNFVGQVGIIVVAVSNDAQLIKNFGEEDGKRFAREQAGAQIQSFLLGLVEQGLATTWVGFFEDSQVKRALKVPKDLIVEAMFPIGKESKVNKGQRKDKPALDDMVYFDSWKNDVMAPYTKLRASWA